MGVSVRICDGRTSSGKFTINYLKEKNESSITKMLQKGGIDWVKLGVSDLPWISSRS
jgi:hypothetical protein